MLIDKASPAIGSHHDRVSIKTNDATANDAPIEKKDRDILFFAPCLVDVNVNSMRRLIFGGHNDNLERNLKQRNGHDSSRNVC